MTAKAADIGRGIPRNDSSESSNADDCHFITAGEGEVSRTSRLMVAESEIQGGRSSADYGGTRRRHANSCRKTWRLAAHRQAATQNVCRARFAVAAHGWPGEAPGLPLKPALNYWHMYVNPDAQPRTALSGRTPSAKLTGFSLTPQWGRAKYSDLYLTQVARAKNGPLLLLLPCALRLAHAATR